MNQTLDSFESALLAELRQYVVDHPAPVVSRRPRRRLRAVAAAGTAVAASVVTVLGLGGTGGSPAYAVSENDQGDVTVTVHRLDDADGLEQALRDLGIDADVNYADNPLEGAGEGAGKGWHPLPLELTDADNVPWSTPENLPPDPPADLTSPVFPCGTEGEPGKPATLTQQGEDWVLRIPANSPLQEQHIDIGTDAEGAFAVGYRGSEVSYGGSVQLAPCVLLLLAEPGSSPQQ